MADEPIDGTLGEGLLSNNANVLYTVPDGMRARITWLSLYNNTGGALLCVIFVRRNGSSRRFHSVNLAAATEELVLHGESGLRLSEGDALQGSAATAGQIEYVVCGVEELVSPGEPDR